MEMLIDFPGGSRVDAHFGKFTVATDQPPAASAPTPFAVFLSSIGTCAGIYVLGFCQERKIPFEDISIVERTEYGKKEDGKSFLEKIVIEISVPPDFPEKYRKTLIKVADQCAVKKAILNPPLIEVRTEVRK